MIRLDQPIKMSLIGPHFEGRVLFLTGCTGFLGKVLLEKILFSLNVKKIYILVRNKKDQDIKTRLKEIFDSPVMKRVKETRGSQYLHDMVFPVVGDLNEELVVPKEIKQEIEYIIHGAATLLFNEDLDVAIKNNVFGTLKIFQLAKECENLKNLVHISTSYTNFPQHRYVGEKVYELELPNREPLLEFCQRVCKMEKKKVKELEAQYIKKLNFPNTYAFSKRLTENILKLLKPKDFTLTIFRPSIICCSYLDPYPGWVDCVSAMGSIFVSTGMGVNELCRGTGRVVGDIIPVDFVANSIILCAYHYSESKELNVLQCGSSSLNPIQWRIAQYSMLWYYNTHTPKQSFFKPRFKFCKTKLEYDFLFYIKYTLPIHAMYLFLGEKKLKMLKILEKKSYQIANAFGPFTSNDCIFDTNHLEGIQKILPEEDNDTFFTDVKMIEWHTLFQRMLYGLSRWILKEDIKDPFNRNLITTSFMAPKDCILSPEPENLFQSILHSKRVEMEILKLLENTLFSFHNYFEKTKEVIQNSIFLQSSLGTKVVAKFLRRYVKHYYHTIKVDENLARKISNLSDGPLIFLPTRSENVDYWMIPYLCLNYSIQIPHTSLANVYLGRTLLGKLGAFFQPDNDHTVDNAVYLEYIEQMLLSKINLQFPVLNQRVDSRLLHFISYVTKKLHNCHVIPIQISHPNSNEIQMNILDIISVKNLGPLDLEYKVQKFFIKPKM